MHSFRAVRLYWVLLAATAALHAQRAQHPAGEIRLEVKDPSGAVMEASGSLQNPATGIARVFQTDSQGTYVFQSLPYGRYRLEVSKRGFATQSKLINVQSGTPVLRIVRMALAPQASKIDVVAPTALPGTDLALDEIPVRHDGFVAALERTLSGIEQRANANQVGRRAGTHHQSMLDTELSSELLLEVPYMLAHREHAAGDDALHRLDFFGPPGAARQLIKHVRSTFPGLPRTSGQR